MASTRTGTGTTSGTVSVHSNQLIRFWQPEKNASADVIAPFGSILIRFDNIDTHCFDNLCPGAQILSSRILRRLIDVGTEISMLLIYRVRFSDGGSSMDPCSETYAGSAPFSEVETRSMSEYIESINTKFFAYLSFHSYSQLLMFPYGHTTEHLENYDELVRK